MVLLGAAVGVEPLRRAPILVQLEAKKLVAPLAPLPFAAATATVEKARM